MERCGSLVGNFCIVLSPKTSSSWNNDASLHGGGGGGGDVSRSHYAKVWNYKTAPLSLTGCFLKVKRDYPQLFMFILTFNMKQFNSNKLMGKSNFHLSSP